MLRTMRGAVLPMRGSWAPRKVPATPTLRSRPVAALGGSRRPVRSPRAAPPRAAPKGPSDPVFLSDLIAFESDSDNGTDSDEPADPTERVQDIIERANRVLEEARQVLGPESLATAAAPSSPLPPAPAAPATPQAAAPVPSSNGGSGAGSVVGRVGPALSNSGKGGGAPTPAAGAEQSTRRWGPSGDDRDNTRHVLQAALDEMARGGGASSGASSGDAPLPSESDGGGGGGSGGGSTSSGAAPPSWAASFLSAPTGGAGGPQLQAAAGAPAPPVLAFAEPEPPAPTAALLFASQSEQDRERARNAVLPPLQSILELTSAFRPPERGAPESAEGAPAAAPALAGRALADGSGALPDGSTWEKKSGVEYGANGYWKRWHLLRGTADGGRVQWEETWWEASDWTGFKEMGAEKQGNDAAGGAWHEAWTERLHYAGADLDAVVERKAHKWAASPEGDEWEEKWGEYYHAAGRVDKWADKWGKQGPNVWHERWGEDYDGVGAVVKWTDKWAERLLPGGAHEQWGDKWRESFGDGRGEKNGEVWTVDGSGHRYQRWWGEQHHGDGNVRRFGNSTSGEVWDDTTAMDTYYNPIPHFGYALALAHSPQLKSVPLRPKEVDEDDPFGPGIDAL